MLSIAEQQSLFDSYRDSIDRELRNTGFEEFVSKHGIDPSLGRLVVARSFQYSSQLASLDLDRDPRATRLATQHEVGIMIEDERRRAYKGIRVAQALHGEPQELVDIGTDLDHVQFVVVEASITKLLNTKVKGPLPFLTKSLLKIDPCGD